MLQKLDVHSTALVTSNPVVRRKDQQVLPDHREAHLTWPEHMTIFTIPVRMGRIKLQCAKVHRQG